MSAPIQTTVPQGFADSMRLVMVVAAMAFAATVSTALAQTNSAPKLLSDAEVKAKYENCEGGWYSGPRPGKARFAKDPWLWVVTPAFAQKFCMPPEFVSADLKGAEAVAFRVLAKGDDENCGFGGNPAVCSGETVLRFELYIKSDVKLPKAHEGRYFQRSILPSAKLISDAPKQVQFLKEQMKQKPEPALKPHFDGQQVGVEGVKDGKVAWPIVSLFEQTHFGAIFEGIDYYAFEGSTGFFENPGIKQNNVTRFFLTFARPDRDRSKPRTGQSLAGYAHAIELPQAFTDQVATSDRTRGRNVAELARRALGPGATTGKP